ncbi:EAL domain-containing protein [Pseudoruegeria sp. SK021]|uniref:EAL domain-containing protein n=1 Tax=Pseudoruegeria sp. SK021 TaxID=1933035 RepID=UPI000A22C758|nr:EAL domain-containing protein [Pseudoruegeria sp. SK021]OSP55654.1 diguanylate phosphodiesterase [Pseudoruegeria sp. SK021]
MTEAMNASEDAVPATAMTVQLPDNPLRNPERPVRALVADALRRGAVTLAYQPVMQARRPDRPAFYEGLIRLLDATGNVIPARVFMDEIESNDLGRQIDCAALDFGLAELAKVPGLRLSINVSARTINDPRWLEILQRGLAVSPYIAERLILEITERSAMSDPDRVRNFMTSLQRRGICFALDDFGAGYTSLRHFKEFSFDIMKIDGQFSQRVHDDRDNQVLIQALISVARHFGMMTVAEAVESEQDMRFLIASGIDALQGYHFAAPSIRPAWKRLRQKRIA